MPVQATLYQRIFHRDLFLSPAAAGHSARYTIMRRNCTDRICIFMSISLAVYILWYIFSSPNYYVRYQNDRVEKLAYKHAIAKLSPMMENKQLCLLDQVDLIFLVISSSSHFLERQSIRETWGSMSDIFGVHSQRLFVVGYKANGNLYKDLLNEAKHEQDILYLPVNDDSPTLKELHAYRWLEQHCSNVIYMFKTEDDLFVNSFLLHELVRELKINSNKAQNRYIYNVSIEPLLLAQIDTNATNFLFGWAFQPGRPERNLTFSPYYVSNKEYSKELFPRYCSGFGYLMNAKTRNTLTIEGFKVEQPFRFPDIFITGILAENLNFVCETLPFTYYQGIADQCIELIRKNNKKLPSASSSPVLICSTGRHTGQNSFSDYSKIWTSLKHVYADRLQTTNN